MPELLVELFSEEIPARMQARAAEDLRRMVCERLQREQLAFARADAFVTPRRLALVVDGLPERQPDIREERKGPRVGAPEGAVQGFLRGAGLASLDEAEARETDKGPVWFAVRTRPGAATAEVAATILAEVLPAFPWPKSMRWGAGSFRWVRPLHAILAILDGRPIPFRLSLGDGAAALVAGGETRGHRFLAPAPIEVTSSADWCAKLRAANVLVDREERKRLIGEGVRRLAEAEGLRLRDDPALLDEVAGLVEWPVPMLGRIDAAFMDVPPEVLVTAMRAHQKYFSLLNADDTLAPRFVVVANTETADDAAIVAGNERVLRARLSDAKFFWEQDRKRTLESRVPKLAERVFHAKLGSDLERIGRLSTLAESLATRCGADPASAVRAARLCKADLTSAMVGEFPELQGLMGRYYALHDREPGPVADAIAGHYAPQGPSDRCPSAPVSAVVALADKLDTLAGFFAIDEKPTGSRDPFALRRAALGVIRIAIENRLRLNLRPVLAGAAAAYPEAIVDGRADAVAADLLAFFADRLKVHLREEGVRHDLIAAVFAGGAEDDIVRLLARVEALRDFLATDDGANLLTAYRRASNIVRIEENKDGARYEGDVETHLLAEHQERDLHRALADARGAIDRALSGDDFRAAMTVLAGLRAPVDAFFDAVQVNCPDAGLRANRLNLLSQIRSALEGVADFSQIEG